MVLKNPKKKSIAPRGCVQDVIEQNKAQTYYHMNITKYDYEILPFQQQKDIKRWHKERIDLKN